MTENYKNLLEQYLIVERVREDLENSPQESLLDRYRLELRDIDDNWSHYSGDSAGHASMCLSLKIECLQKGYHL